MSRCIKENPNSHQQCIWDIDLFPDHIEHQTEDGLVWIDNTPYYINDKPNKCGVKND